MTWRSTHPKDYPVPNWLDRDPRFDETTGGPEDEMVSFESQDTVAVEYDEEGEAVRDLAIEVWVDHESPHYHVNLRERGYLAPYDGRDESNMAVMTDDPVVARKVIDWLFANVKSLDFVDQHFPEGPIRRLFSADGQPMFLSEPQPQDPQFLERRLQFLKRRLIH